MNPRVQQCLAAALTLLPLAVVAQAGDWSHWRGPLQNGAAPEPAPVTTWSPEGENLLWKSDIGGRTTPIVLNDRVYFLTPTGEGLGLRERAVCLDADTGKLIWEHPFNVFLTDIVENRLGWTAMAGDPETGNVYAHGTGGEFTCFDRDGKVLWKHSLTEEFGRVSGYGGRLYTPIVDEDRVIMSFIASGWGEHAKTGHRFVAFDKRDGKVVWWSEPGGPPSDTVYPTPVVGVLGGRRLLIAPNVDGWVYALLAHTGEPVWKYRFSRRPLNTSPVIEGNRVFVTHSEENYDSTNMGAIACIDGSKSGDLSQAGQLWRQETFEIGYCSPAVANDRLYVIDNSANMSCFDAKNGKEVWRFKLGRVGKGSPVVTSDGVIYAGEQNGVFWILKDAGDKCEPLSKTEFPPHGTAVDELFGSPAVVDGRVYFQTRYGTYCLGKKGAKVAASVPAAPPETEQPGEKADCTLIVPAEVTLAPGESVKFELRAFTSGGKAAGAKLESPDPQWTAAGAKGELKSDGTSATFTAAADGEFSAGQIKVKWVGDKEAVARVRVVPKKPPFKFDFESVKPDGVPAGWLGVAAKTKVVEKDGSKVLAHLAERPHPGFMRIRTYMTSPIAGGYTIQADLLAGEKKTAVSRIWPDMGVIDARYELALMGEEPDHPRLRLVTWTPVPRLQKEVPFAWQPGVWYRMKFEVKPEGGKARLRGKVWPRDEQEPAAWTIEAEDPFPNLEGSPALYGYANGTTPKSKGAEIFFDNVVVTPNE